MKRHLLSAADLTRDDAELVLRTAEELRSLADRPIKKLPALRGRTVVNLFFEDSTRTRISFEAAAKRLSADVINFSAKGSSLSQGREPQGHRADPRGDGRRRGRRPARRQRRPAPARALGLGPLQRGQRRRRHPRAPHPGAARRVHDVAPPRQGRRQPRRPPGRDRRRRAAQPGRPLQRAAAAHARRRGHPGRPAHAAPGRRRGLAGRDVVRPRRGAPQGRRGDDAAGPARADERLVLPDRARVLPPLRPRRQRMASSRTTRSSCTPGRWSAAWRSPPTWPTPTAP